MTSSSRLQHDRLSAPGFHTHDPVQWIHKLRDEVEMSGGSRTVNCQCGSVRLRLRADPVRVSVCHCFECQKRSGSAFSAQARFRRADVVIEGELRQYVRTADSGVSVPQYFCPVCGNGIFYLQSDEPDILAIPVGMISGQIPAPATSVWESRRMPWVQIVGDAVEHRQD